MSVVFFLFSAPWDTPAARCSGLQSVDGVPALFFSTELGHRSLTHTLELASLILVKLAINLVPLSEAGKTRRLQTNQSGCPTKWDLFLSDIGKFHRQFSEIKSKPNHAGPSAECLGHARTALLLTGSSSLWREVHQVGKNTLELLSFLLLGFGSVSARLGTSCWR